MLTRTLLMGCALLVAGAAAAAEKANAVEATVEALKVAVYDRDGKAVKEQSIAVFSKAPAPFTIDASQKFTVSFAVKSKAGGADLKPHQAFVLFEHIESKADVVFVADAQKEGGYKLDVNMAKEASDFGGYSGKYNIRLVIGDAKIKSGLNWVISEASLTVPAAAPEIVRKSQKVSYERLPEIEHQFREPEKRPSDFISMIFTIGVLAPAVLLLILWARIGINFSNMPASIYVPLFHFGLIGLFGLYGLFWLQLNMFETLKYIGVAGALTFFAGNRLLRTLASRRKEKTA